jgi:hypothetical protein
MSFIRNDNWSEKGVIINKVLSEGSERINFYLIIRISRWSDMTIGQGYDLIMAALGTDMGEIRE